MVGEVHYPSRDYVSLGELVELWHRASPLPLCLLHTTRLSLPQATHNSPLSATSYTQLASISH